MKTSALLALLIISAAASTVLAQDVGSGIVVVKFSWHKERIRPRPSQASLASKDELIQQSQREQQLAAARNAADKGKVTKLETQISTHQQATVQARDSEMPLDGYKYKVTLRNESEKTIKSIDWDYLFLDPVTRQELARHQFSSDETIKPGKSKEVSVLYLSAPVKTLPASSLGKREGVALIEQVVIARIHFSDGSVWPRP